MGITHTQKQHTNNNLVDWGLRQWAPNAPQPCQARGKGADDSGRHGALLPDPPRAMVASAASLSGSLAPILHPLRPLCPTANNASVSRPPVGPTRPGRWLPTWRPRLSCLTLGLPAHCGRMQFQGPPARRGEPPQAWRGNSYDTILPQRGPFFLFGRGKGLWRLHVAASPQGTRLTRGQRRWLRPPSAGPRRQRASYRGSPPSRPRRA